MKKGVIIAFLILALFHAAYAQSPPVILTSDNTADYAVARVWAEKIGAGLVTTPWGSMTSDAVSGVISSGASVVYVVGGSVAVPNAEEELKGYGLSIIRVGGANREETSLLVAERFSAARAVVLDGYDSAAMEDAVTVGKVEGSPIVFLHRGDADAGTKLRRTGIGEITLIPNPALEDDVRDSIKNAGIKITELTRAVKNAVQEAIDLAEERINDTEALVRSIKDGPSLAAARLLVEAKIRLSQAKEAFTDGNYKEAFINVITSKEASSYASSIYNGRYAGRILDMVDQANTDISTMDVSGAKDALRNTGAPYGIGVPVPPVVDLAAYMVDIPGYTKSRVEAGIEYDMRAKYTKKVGQSVNVEIYKRADEGDAIKWVEQVKFAPGVESRDWESTTLMGYSASMKRINYTITDKKSQEVYLRVAVGNLGIFSKFTQSVGLYDNLTPLEEAQAMVEEVTEAVIKTIESLQ
ncbi:MAG: hypothetical protein ACE5IH_09645 [Thermodesulfobacteriota bacterium]